MFAFEFEVRTKNCPCKNKTVEQTNSYFNNSIVQSAVHWHEHMPQPWPPLINGLVDDARLELSSAFKFLFFVENCENKKAQLTQRERATAVHV